MTTPSPDVSVTTLEGAALDDAVTGLQTGPASAALWENLTASGYAPQLDQAAGAQVTQHSQGRGYTYVSVPFATAQGALARLVWDDLMGEPRAAYGLLTAAGGAVTRVDVQQSVGGRVQQTNSLVRRTNQDVDLLDASGHTLQMYPVGEVPQGAVAGVAVAEAISGCSVCQALVDILFGVVACGGIAQYFICDVICTGLTAGTGIVICSIACGIFVGLCCYVGGILLKDVTCETWCG
jgi:hypothetical protein